MHSHASSFSWQLRRVAIPSTLVVGTKVWDATETWLIADPGLLHCIFALGLLCSNLSYGVSEKGESFRKVEVEGELVAEDGLC